MLRTGAVIGLFMLAGCTTAGQLDTTVCDPAKVQCYAVTEEFLERHFFTDEQNYMLKENLKVCRERL